MISEGRESLRCTWSRHRENSSRENLTVPYYSTGGGTATGTDPYLNWFTYVPGQSSIPQTISITYGDPEYYVFPLVRPIRAAWRARRQRPLIEGVRVGDEECLIRSSSGDVSVWFLSPVSQHLIQVTQTINTTTLLVGPWVIAVGGTTSGEKPELLGGHRGGCLFCSISRGKPPLGCTVLAAAGARASTTSHLART